MSAPRPEFPPQIAVARAGFDARWREMGLHRGLTVRQAIETAPGGGRLVLAEAGVEASHAAGDLVEAGRTVAVALNRLGVRPGDVVALQLQNTVLAHNLMLGAIFAGCVVAPMLPAYGTHELDFALRGARARLFVTAARFGETDALERLRAMPPLPDLGHVVVVGDGEAGGAMSWSDFLAGAAPGDAPLEVRASDPCVLLYTSGTTSRPKGVLHSHDTLLSATANHASSYDRVSSPYLFSPASGHIGGVIQVLCPLLRDMTAVSLDRWDAETAVRLISRHGVTNTSGAPVFLHHIFDTAARLGIDISTLRTARLGGTSVMPSDVEGWSARGIAAYRAYGSTEQPNVSSSGMDAPLADRAFTDGPPQAGSGMRIVDAHGEDLPPGAQGELAISGPQQFLGYTDPALNGPGNFLADGWFLTGDLGVLDSEGRLAISGRKKDIIIRGGENISATEVEEVLARMPGVLEAAVVGAPDAVFGERVCAFILPRGAAAPDLGEVRAHFLRSGLAKLKTPERIVQVADFPRTPTGKIRKTELREALAAGLPVTL